MFFYLSILFLYHPVVQAIYPIKLRNFICSYKSQIGRFPHMHGLFGVDHPKTKEQAQVGTGTHERFQRQKKQPAGSDKPNSRKKHPGDCLSFPCCCSFRTKVKRSGL
jgi:hypothetical protein